MFFKLRLIFIYLLIGIFVSSCSSVKDYDFLDFLNSSEKRIIEGKILDTTKIMPIWVDVIKTMMTKLIKALKIVPYKP